MNISELDFKENNDRCVWCSWGELEFYWEARTNQILITPNSYRPLYVPESFKATDVRKEIKKFLKDAFNV